MLAIATIYLRNEGYWPIVAVEGSAKADHGTDDGEE
jgi:hypothetical protein